MIARKLMPLSLALLLGLGAVAGCGESDGEGGGSDIDLKVGNLVPLTGDLSDFGPPGDKAATLAVDQIKQAISDAGVDHAITLATEDDQTSDQAGVSAARKLVGDGASCIAGSWASSVTIPVARSVAIPERVLQISPSSTSDDLSKLDDGGLINRTSPPDSFQGPTLAAAIGEDLGGASGKTVNIGARNDSYGNGLARAFRDAWSAAGGRVGAEVIYDPDATSYDQEARRLTGGSPDATVIFDFPETFAKVGPALARTGRWEPSTAWGTDGLASSSLAKGLGPAVMSGFRGTTPGAPDDSDAGDAFDRLYKSSEPTDVGRQAFDAQNFDAVMLCYLASVAAGSTEGEAMAKTVAQVSAPPGVAVTWKQLPKAIETLQAGKEIDYQGVSGALDLNEDGDPTAGVYDIYQFTDEEMDLIGEVPVAAAKDRS